MKKKSVKSKKKLKKKKSSNVLFKKQKKRRSKKTVKTRKHRVKYQMKDLYPFLNRVQLYRETVVFVTEIDEAAIVENTIKDLGLIYNRKDMKTRVEFTVKPNEIDVFGDEDDLLDIEYLDDEIPEIDDIFS